MNDIDALVLLSKKGSITGAVDLAERLWPGSHHHRKTNGAALARAAGAIMARLQKRGFVEALRGAWRNTYRITTEGRTYLGSLDDRPGSHVESVKVHRCDRSSCMGNEEGCNSAECGADAGWRRLSHGGFVAWFNRCPRQCRPNTRRAPADCGKTRKRFKLAQSACCKQCHLERKSGFWMCVLKPSKTAPPIEICCNVAEALIRDRGIRSVHTDVIFQQHRPTSQK